MTFEEFAAARLRAVLQFAAVLAGDRGIAEDLVQEVLIRANGRWQAAGRSYGCQVAAGCSRSR